ncbi:CLUMA_CG015232, isoform A, partial [Clunio marinus]
IYYIDTLNWFFCALSRFIIIKVLPIWNWRYLGNARCLIAKAENPPQRFKSNNFNAKNCRACEHFNVIDAVENTKYNLLYNKYLLRGLPVIITDSVESNESSESLAKFLGHLYSNMSSIVEHKACDLETNLMITQRADIEKAFRILREYNDLTSWFLSFRTCRFQALKASRLIMKKPYFYPKNLQAPSTAWVLLSDNYESDESSLTFFGLIIVSQLKGTLKIHLKPKD